MIPEQRRGPLHLIVLRALGLGDLLTAVPALRGLRAAFPAHRLVLATTRALAPLAYRTGAVDEVLGTHGLHVLDWPGPTDVAVNLHGSGPESFRLLDALRPVRRIGHRAPGWSGPAWDATSGERERWCVMLREHGIEADARDLRLTRPRRPSPAPRAIVVHPGAAYGSRMWPAERFARVARDLTEAGHRVVITGSDQEVPLATRVARLAELHPRQVLAGRTDLDTLVALIARARLLICGDTGVAHLSYAFGTPSVVLFGPVSSAAWGPPEGGPHITLSVDRLRRGDPFSADPDPALLGVGSDWVAASARRLLAEAPRRTFAL